MMTSKKEDGYNKLLPTRIRAIMDKRKMKQKDLAEKSGISRQSIGYYADGSNIPNAEVLAKIAKALDVSADYLLGLSDDESPKSGNISKGFVAFPETCEDAIDLISQLSWIEDTQITVYSGEEDIDGWSKESVNISLYDPGLVKYYHGIEGIRQSLKNLPDSLNEAAWRFQAEARQKLMDEARNTKLHINELSF